MRVCRRGDASAPRRTLKHLAVPVCHWVWAQIFTERAGAAIQQQAIACTTRPAGGKRAGVPDARSLGGAGRLLLFTPPVAGAGGRERF